MSQEIAQQEERLVYKAHGKAYTKAQFLHYYERKVFKTITKYNLIQKDDNVCIATSGGKDSITVLYLTAKYCKKHDIPFFALCIDEGIAHYRDHTVEDLKAFCTAHTIPHTIVSFKVRFGAALDEIREKAMQEYGKKPCTVCGILRRALLNRASRELKATKLVTGHNMDDEAQSLLMNLVLGNMRHNASLGPVTGINTSKHFTPRVKPLYFMNEKETRLYCLLKGFAVHFTECPNISHSFRAVVRDSLNDLELQHEGAKNGLINAFMEIMPLLKEKYRSDKQFTICTRCGEASAGAVCNVCRLQEELDLKIEEIHNGNT